MTPIKQPSEPVAKIIHTKGTGLLEGTTITKVMLDVKYVDLPEGTQLYTQQPNTVSLEQYNKLLDKFEKVDIKAQSGLCYYDLNTVREFHKDIRRLCAQAIEGAEMDDE